MGCDIHGMLERKKADGFAYWVNKGDPELYRDYQLFSILAGVRNGFMIEPVSEPKGIPIDDKYEIQVSKEFKAWYLDYGSDAHSGSYLTLKELSDWLKAHPEIENEQLKDLINQLKKLKTKKHTDEDVRIVFFFDN